MTDDFVLGEQVSFEIALPENDSALVNGRLLRVMYATYLEKVTDPSRDFQERFRMRSDMLSLLSAVENFEHVTFVDEQDKRLSLHSLMTAITSAYVLGAMASSDDRATKLIRKSQASAGKKSGETRRKKAEATWHPHAIARAIKFRSEEPTLSQQDLASKVVDLWKDQSMAIPSTSSVLKLIGALEASGKLKKRYR